MNLSTCIIFALLDDGFLSLPTFIISSYLYDVCFTVWCFCWCLPTCMRSAERCDVPTWMMSAEGFDVPTWMMSAQLYDVCLAVWCLPTCMKSAQLHEVCSTIWWLPVCIMSAVLYDVRFNVWCLPTCMISSCLYDVCRSVWCFSVVLISAYLYKLPVLCLPTWTYNVWLPVQSDFLLSVCLPSCIIFGYLYHVFLYVCQPALVMLNFMSAYLYNPS
jgi:hypothetical protein